MRAAALAALIALAVPAPAAAGELQIASGRVDALDAGAGWVAWPTHGKHQTLWHDGAATTAPSPYLWELGTDAAGRAVGLFTRCGDERCVMHERVLPDGRVTTRLATPAKILPFDESHGTVIAAAEGTGHLKGIYLARPGADRLRRITTHRPGAVSISTKAMTDLDQDGVLYGASRADPHRWQRFGKSADPDLIRGEVGPFTFLEDVQADGRFAYWLKKRSRPDDEWSAGRIVRVDPGASRPHVESFVPPRPIDQFAVTRGRLYYTDRSTGAVYEYRRPKFR